MNRGSFLAIILGVVAAAGLVGAIASNRNDAATALDTPAEPTPAAQTNSDPTGSNQSAEPDSSSTTETTEPSSAEAPPMLGQAGTLENIDGWLQTEATSLEEFDGKVRIVQFWTYSCHNCTATIPFLQEIYADHQGDKFEIIGVHAPEFSFEEDIANVQQAAIELGVTWPIAIDNSKTNFRSWQPGRRFWPRTFVLDQNGGIRFDRIGEGNYEELADTVNWLLENGP